ncbi:hypothetical protein J4434_07425 [Candidatus Woesearchaeota archaeon]|nr:hypothetical protein [Candidatus Woesearchaeota archaeon]
MLKIRDIDEAKTIFKGWDNNHMWDTPSLDFLEHTKKKARETLKLASYLLNKIENTHELDDISIASMWVITKCYYSMFFLVEYLLGLDGKKIPEGTQDTHKTIYLAFLYYYLIKNSELEQDSKKIITTSRMSKALVLFKDSQDESLVLQRIKKSASDLKSQKEQRHKFTYRENRPAELYEAKKSFEKAREFREIIEEYIQTKKV